MLQKIIDLLQQIFSIFSSKNNETVIINPPTLDDLKEEHEEIDIPQDAADVAPDSIITEIPVFVEEDNQDDFSIIEEDTEITETETEPEVIVPTHVPKYLWCLDNGHGSFTKGKRSPKLADGRQFLEYEFNRDIVNRMIVALEKQGVKYFNVVPEVDIDNFLQGRVERANDKVSDLPKLYVSIHANAAPASSGGWCKPSISGIETWHYYGNKKGRQLAEVFQRHLLKQTRFKNRNLKSKKTGQFYVLRKTNMTSVLTECGFYNNPNEVLELLKDEVRQKIADAHVNAILEVEKGNTFS